MLQLLLPPGALMIRTSPPALNSPGGFTVTELMVIVALIGILAAVTIPLGLPFWRRERVNSLATEFAGWLGEIAKHPERGGTACTVTLNPPGSFAPGAALASVSPASCAPNSTFRIPASFGQDDFSVGASITSPYTFTFTPRGAMSSASDIQIRFAVASNRPVRCVRISGTLGLIRMGRNDSSSNTSTACTDFSSI